MFLQGVRDFVVASHYVVFLNGVSIEMAFSYPFQSQPSVISKVILPYSAIIPGGLTIGKQIQIQGKVSNTYVPGGFSINICAGPQVEPNCLFHFNPRFNEGCIVRNTLTAGSWGPEERGGGMPLQKGPLFEIIILVDSMSYKVAVNGRHFTEYSHRMPMEQAQYIYIAGKDLSINFIKFEGGYVSAPPAGFNLGPPGYGVMPPPYTASSPNHGTSSVQQYNPAVPLKQGIPGGMVPGRMIHLSGAIYSTAQRFSINLQSGPSDYADINLHFDVRINYGDNRKIIVRNHRSGNNWGPEERQISHFPFHPGSSFDILILAEPTKFKVAVNNDHFVDFVHRLPLQNATTLTVNGDVRLTSLRFQ